MIVDDDEIVLNSAKEQLTVLGYHVTSVNHPQLALQHLQTENFSVILADYEMPEMTGLELFASVEESHPDTSRLIFSSGISMGELSEAIESGRVYRHVSKPWLKEDLQATVGNAMERYRMLKENETLQARNITLSQKLATAGESAAASESATVPVEGGGEADSSAPVIMGAEAEDLAMQSFNKMLFTFHPNLGNTAMRALAICETLGEILEMDPKDFRNLCIAAQLHDIGLLANEIGAVRRWMRDPEKCSEEELEEINKLRRVACSNPYKIGAGPVTGSPDSTPPRQDNNPWPWTTDFPQPTNCPETEKPKPQRFIGELCLEALFDAMKNPTI